MSRKNRAPKREVLADPLYNSKIVTRLINRVMLDGKRGTAATIVYDAFEQIKEATGNDALEVFETCLLYTSYHDCKSRFWWSGVHSRNDV